jgi:hypothetical protein
MKYTIINQDSAYNLSVNINLYIESGWIPQGGVCVCYEGGDLRYYQAMIKNEG